MIAANDKFWRRTRAESIEEWLCLTVAIVVSAAFDVVIGYAFRPWRWL